MPLLTPLVAVAILTDKFIAELQWLRLRRVEQNGGEGSAAAAAVGRARIGPVWHLASAALAGLPAACLAG